MRRLASPNANKPRELAAGASRLGDRAARRRRLPAGGRRDLLRERADQGALRAGARAGAWVLGEDSGIEVDGARRPPGRPVRPLGAGDERRAAARASSTARADRRRPLRLRARRALARRRRAPRHAGRSRGRSPTEPRGSEGFGYDPVFVPAGETRPSPSSATSGSAELAPRPGGAALLGATQPGRALRPASAAPASRRSAQPPVDLGAEDDHVRHHVQPDEQERRPAEAPSARSRCRRGAGTSAAPGTTPRARPRRHERARQHLAQRQLLVREQVVDGERRTRRRRRARRAIESVYATYGVADEARREALEDVVRRSSRRAGRRTA